MLRMNDQISTLPKEEKPSASRQERGCYTVDDLAQILGVGHKAIYALIHKKAFPAIRIKRRWTILLYRRVKHIQREGQIRLCSLV